MKLLFPMGLMLKAFICLATAKPAQESIKFHTLETTTASSAITKAEDEEEKLEEKYESFEEIEPKFSEPVVMMEMWSGEEKKFVYHYPKTTVVSFRAFKTSFKLKLKRKDGVFGSGISMSDYHPEESEKNFMQGESAAPAVLSSVCMYEAHIPKKPLYSGLISLCDQRLDGIITIKKTNNNALRFWTTTENVNDNNNNVTDNEDDSGDRANNFGKTSKIVHRVAQLNSAKNASEEELDLRSDGDGFLDDDDEFMKTVESKFDEIKQNDTRYRMAISDKKDSTIQPRLVELFVLADHQMEISHGGDRGRVTQKIASMVALMNSLYKPLNIEFLIAHIQYGFRMDLCWNNYRVTIDRRNRETFSSSYLNCVKQYRRRSSCEEPNGPMKKSDHLMLVSGHNFCDSSGQCTLGIARVYTICSWENSVSLASAAASSPVWKVGLTISHELAHSFGALHDWKLGNWEKFLLAKQRARPLGGCTCTLPNGKRERRRTKKCIMSPIVNNQLTWSWSDCSYADIDFSKESNLHSCLYNRLDKYRNIESMLQSSCGNGRLDPGEECENQGTGCCTDRCVLREGAECNVGPCCTSNCKLRAKSTVCKRATWRSSCDLDDVCDGESFKCGVKYKPNGSPCRNAKGEESHCFRGECRSQSDGCVDVLGEGFEANKKMMEFPLGDGKRRNGCTARPCQFAKLSIYLGKKGILDTALETCAFDEDSVCGSLICHQTFRARSRRDIENGTIAEASIRQDFHRVMSERFGADKWSRTLEKSGMLAESSMNKLRQGAEMSMKQRLELLFEFMPKTIFTWSNDGRNKLILFPIYSSNPGMAPSGASCGEGGKKMCHNGRCLTLEQFRSAVWDPSDEVLDTTTVL